MAISLLTGLTKQQADDRVAILNKAHIDGYRLVRDKKIPGVANYRLIFEHLDDELEAGRILELETKPLAQ